jgi:hypothetical protein
MSELSLTRKTKTCYKCKKVKALSEFHKGSKTGSDKHGRKYQCKVCDKEERKIYLQTSHGKSKQLQWEYGISLDQYNEMMRKQDGRCAICGVPNFIRKLVIDHCHDTGKVRGLLCDRCNTGIGKLRDNIDILQSAIKYLTENQ